jgi:hypothetical protein
MGYIKNIASIVNGADACGGGMKKQGLVYGSDFARIKGNYLDRNTKLPANFKFTLPGQADKSCCGTVTAAVSTYASRRGRNMTMR